MSHSDVLHFAETKHKGLPEHVKHAGRSSRQRGFYAMVREVQSGKRPLHSVSEAVSNAAKKMEPKDSSASQVNTSPVTAIPQPASEIPPEVSRKMSNVQLFFVSDIIPKMANISSMILRSHKAIHQAGAARRQVLAKEIDKLRKHNERLQNESEKAQEKAKQSEDKVREAELQVAAAGKTVEQMQAMQMAQRPPPPPEQPPYGSMLLGGMPGGGAPMSGATQPAPQPAAPTAPPAPPPVPNIPGMQSAPQV